MLYHFLMQAIKTPGQTSEEHFQEVLESGALVSHNTWGGGEQNARGFYSPEHDPLSDMDWIFLTGERDLGVNMLGGVQEWLKHKKSTSAAAKHVASLNPDDVFGFVFNEEDLVLNCEVATRPTDSVGGPDPRVGQYLSFEKLKEWREKKNNTYEVLVKHRLPLNLATSYMRGTEELELP
tara:strand:- start:2544 stop:3080 length:537 start_codon:yes stop_codon:yes gene_type:complete